MTNLKAQEMVRKIIEVMETLMACEGDLGIREIAERCDASKSTVHRILLILKENGWVYQDEVSKNYRIGIRFLVFANEWRTQLELVRQSAPIIEDLVEKTRQTAILSVIEEDRAVCLHKVESRNAIKLVSRIGEKTPLHATATGKALLAHASKSLQEEILTGDLRSFTPFTITSPILLREEMARIREKRYAISVEEVDPGAASIGVPILGRKGQLIAGLSIAGPRFDFEGRFEEFIPLVVEAASAIAALIQGGEKGA